MANPDGVIHGNSRTNLKGYDINRCWVKNTLFLSAEVSCIDNWIGEIQKDYKVSYILDLHGHSKNYGSFLYFAEANDKNR
jgi:murein tripeptide amidase MpaA